MANALEGIRVIDLTIWLQGPVCAQHLADFGAEVIKVERPQGGDQGRGVRSIKNLPVGDWNQYFLVINRNKKSMTLDLKKPVGREIMYRLVEKSDVFLSNLGRSMLEGWDLGYEKLSSINPQLIYATNTGYGWFGEVNKPSFDMTVQALTGLMARLGEPDQPPIYLGMGSGDTYGGLLSALGIMIALYNRKRTGKGQMLDASLYGAQLFLTAPTLQAYLAGNEKAAKQQSRKTAPNPLWNQYAAKDKWVFLCVPNTDESWARLCRSFEDEELAKDARFATTEKRRRNTKGLIKFLDKTIKKRTAADWMERWKALEIVAMPIGNLADLAADPQAWANDYIVKAHCDEVNREVDVRGLPITLSKTPGSVRTLGPELGQDTELILTDTLGYSWEQVAEFKEQGVIL